MVDIPGTYSLMAHSTEEEVARNFLCFGNPDAVVVVCDATCLERNLNLVLQTLEITPNVLVCVNLLDEAHRKHIEIDLPKLSSLLGVPVVGTTARSKRSLHQITSALDTLVEHPNTATPIEINYPEQIEEAIALLQPPLETRLAGRLNSRWLALRLLDQDVGLMRDVASFLDADVLDDDDVATALEQANDLLLHHRLDSDGVKDMVVTSLVHQAEGISQQVVCQHGDGYAPLDRRLDRILTSRLTGYPIMLGLLAFIFWLTITGANVPSAMLADLLFSFQNVLSDWMFSLGAPDWLHGALILGIYRVVAWVVSVMLPPMAIFFPLFTLLEDAGYLPRIAYNLDKPFQRCHACGKQSLTMCMAYIVLQA